MRSSRQFLRTRVLPCITDGCEETVTIKTTATPATTPTDSERKPISQVCLWHLDMETFKLTCFAKLSVPAGTLGLSLDVLNSIGVLRMETSAATDSRIAESQQRDGDSAPSRETEGTAQSFHRGVCLSCTVDRALQKNARGFVRLTN